MLAWEVDRGCLILGHLHPMDDGDHLGLLLGFGLEIPDTETHG
jgi:hypothetical protein